MLCRGTGILAIWHDIAPEAYDDFVRWHTREHMVERLSVPGFLRGCRYLASNAQPMCFNFYQTETPETLTSAPYLERLNNPTAWTQRVLPHFRNVNRTAGRVVFSEGAGEGGAVATMTCRAVGGMAPAALGEMAAPLLRSLREQGGVVAVHL